LNAESIYRPNQAARRYLFCLAIVVAFALAAKNLARGAIGRTWMAMRDMDVAAEVIGIRPMHAKLTAFAASSFIVGVAGALWGFVHLGAWEPAAFSIDRSFQLLFMVIIGGLGSILGSFLGAAFIVVLPLVLNLSAVSVPIMRVSVLRPDGTALLSPSWVLGATSFGLTAPVAGTYTIVLDPYNDYTGSATVSLS